MKPRSAAIAVWTIFPLLLVRAGDAEEGPAARTTIYHNALTRIAKPKPLLADHTRYVGPMSEATHFEAPALINDPHAGLSVRAWRFSYNARGIIEIPNRLAGDKTAVIVVHPWGIDDGQGWRTPEPAGAAFQCTPIKNAIVLDHARDVVNPLLRRLRDRVKLVGFSLPGKEDPIRASIYRSIARTPATDERQAGRVRLKETLERFNYRGAALPAEIAVDPATPTIAYFQAFPGLDANPPYDPAGFWDLPVPVSTAIDVHDSDYVFYDLEGYAKLRDFLRSQGVTHILLAGYNTDMCVCSTTAGYKNLSLDFDVLLVGDATIATFPASAGPHDATTAAVALASRDLLITQASWIRVEER